MSRKITATFFLMIAAHGWLHSANVNVGVLQKGFHQGVYEWLASEGEFDAEYVVKVSKEGLAKYDVVVVPVCGRRKTLTEQERLSLNAYAYSGGGVLVVGQGIGPFRWQIPLFPEVGQATGRINDHVITVRSKRHPICAGLPWEIITSYYDHLILEPGPSGRPLTGDRAGHVTGLYGKTGDGIVLLLGAQCGVESDESTCQPRADEREMLIRAIAYLASTRRPATRYDGWEKVAQLRRDIEKSYYQRMKFPIWKAEREAMIPLEVLNYRLTKGDTQQATEKVIKSAQKAFSSLKQNAQRTYSRSHRQATKFLDEAGITRLREELEELEREIEEELTVLKESLVEETAELSEKAEPLRRKQQGVTARSGWERESFPIVVHWYGASAWPQTDYVPHYARDLGLTVFSLRQYNITEKSLFDAFGKQGIRVFPGYFSNYFSYGWKDARKTQSSLERYLEKQIKAPSFAGYQADEPRIFASQVSIEQFKEFLQAKYKPEQLRERGVDLANLSLPKGPVPKAATEAPTPGEVGETPEVRRDKFLLVESAECRMQTIQDWFTTMDQWLRSHRPDLRVFATINAGARRPDACPYSLSSRLSLSSTDHYQNGCLETAFLGDLIRAASGGNPTFLCVAPCYDQSARRWKNDLASTMAHGDGCHIFCWKYIFKYPDSGKPHLMMPVDFWNQKEGTWEVTRELTNKMRRLEKYLTKTTSPAKIGLVFSRRSKLVESTLGGRSPDSGDISRQYFYNQEGLYQALVASHIPFEVVYAECLTAENAGKFRAFILNEATCLTGGQVELIREWVENGGHLIASGKTTLYDEWGIGRSDYALADVFGVKYLSTANKENAEFETPVGSAAYHPGREVDKVEATTAQVLGRWRDGDVALTRNSFGKGGCFFIAASELGMCYKGASLVGRSSDLYKEYYPGVRELIEWLARESLGAAGDERFVVEVENCPELVEVVAREQPGRTIIHLTNYSYEDRISGVRIALHPEGKGIATIHYPEGNVKVKTERSEDGITFKVRDFDVHEMIVAEWER